MKIDWSIIISAFMLIISVINLAIAQGRNLKGDTKAEAAENNSLREGIFKANMKLDMVCNTTTDIKTDIKAMDSKLEEHGKQIAVISRDLETAFMRIDELRNQINAERRNDNE